MTKDEAEEAIGIMAQEAYEKKIVRHLRTFLEILQEGRIPGVHSVEYQALQYATQELNVCFVPDLKFVEGVAREVAKLPQGDADETP